MEIPFFSMQSKQGPVGDRFKLAHDSAESFGLGPFGLELMAERLKADLLVAGRPAHDR